MKILIAGAGAVGGVVGAALLGGGREVTFLVRPARAERLRERGLRVATGEDTQVLRPDAVTADRLEGPYDLVLLAVKAAALAQVTDDLAPAVGPGTAIVPFLNGMAHMDALTGRFGTAVLGGTLKVAAQLGDDGTVVLMAPGIRIEVGELDGADTPRLGTVVAALDVPGIEVHGRSDIVDAMWAKWVFIAAVGAVTSLMRAPVGDVVAVPGGTRFAEAVLDEIAGVARASGHRVAAADLAATGAVLTAPGSPTTSSLARDLVAGRPTEVDSVLGDLCDRARDLGAPVPLTEAATLALRVHDQRVAGPGQPA
ncbi:2-dehydropantoate 2-reductase [Streptomyces sulfonofaciens]|uniref:2-dehydropantoate 2-reductase n=1 Tax=Streptomyces sulfonofaciens TaxID=68272 RepID=A0A919GA68_9ACTN|nr:2-dehydropantoate 2-reductase [Streptomyces sulfonofaciens]GHH80219.1 2-dehydropantoate 2-reductase [Streptomyces sulfonofaciens]